VPRILHWLVTEEVEKVEKGQILSIIPYDLLQTKGETCAMFG
jgi:hypothetical protein